MKKKLVSTLLCATMLAGMLEDVKEGIIPKEKYIMEKYGVSEEEARKMVIGE